MAYPYQTQGFTLDNSGRRIVVDPVTRIEEHMRCEVNIDSNNVITNAVSTGTMWRGPEVILKGRDPRDARAFVERICGVCTGTHALTSIRAVENALGIAIPDNANCIRNMMQATLHVHDHRCILSSACAGLGRCSCRPESRPASDLRHRAKPFRMAAILAGIFPRFAKSTEAVYRVRLTWPFP